MTCAMRLHDPCAGEVRLRRAYNHEVPLCWRHVIRLRKGQPPFRWQTAKQLEQWAADRGATARGWSENHAACYGDTMSEEFRSAG